MPSIRISPWLGLNIPLRQLKNVDLPDPFSPTKAWISPALKETETSLSAVTGPKNFEMLLASTMSAPCSASSRPLGDTCSVTPRLPIS